MSISDFFKGLMGGNTQIQPVQALRLGSYIVDADDEKYNIVQGELMQNALATGIDIIAAQVAKIEIQTYNAGAYAKGKDWYRFNVRPNKNQTVIEFWSEAVYRLIKNRELLIVPLNEQLIIAQSFNKDVKAVANTIFTDISREGYDLAGVWTAENAIYINAEYNTPVNKLINSVGTVLDGLLDMATEQYYRQDSERGILQLDTPPGVTDDELTAYVKAINKRFDAYYAKKRSIAVLFQGQRYEQVRDGSSKSNNNTISDIRQLTTEAYNKVSVALKIPPQLLLGDTAPTEESYTNFIKFCISPIVDAFVQSVNHVIYGRDNYLMGNYARVDYTQLMNIDAFRCATSVDKLRADGIYNVNELRRMLSDEPINEPFANDYVITKNYADVEGSD